MGAGTEGQAGVENDLQPVGGLLRQPVGQHHNALADLLGRVIVLPAFLPVGFGEGGDGHGQTELVHRRVQTLPTVIVGVLQIQLDPGKPLELFLQSLVDVIPIRPIFFQKRFELRLILDDQIGKAPGAEGGNHRVDAPGRGFNGKFQPCHGGSLLIPISPTYILPQTEENDNQYSLNFLCIDFLFWEKWYIILFT